MCVYLEQLLANYDTWLAQAECHWRFVVLSDLKAAGGKFQHLASTFPSFFFGFFIAGFYFLRNGPAGSVVCIIRMQQIKRVFKKSPFIYRHKPYTWKTQPRVRGAVSQSSFVFFARTSTIIVLVCAQKILQAAIKSPAALPKCMEAMSRFPVFILAVTSSANLDLYGEPLTGAFFKLAVHAQTPYLNILESSAADCRT